MTSKLNDDGGNDNSGESRDFNGFNGISLYLNVITASP